MWKADGWYDMKIMHLFPLVNCLDAFSMVVWVRTEIRSPRLHRFRRKKRAFLSNSSRHIKKRIAFRIEHLSDSEE